MRWLAAGLASLLCLAAVPSQAQLKGENLLVAPPPGFKVGFKGSRNGMNMLEWIPASETVQDWTEMVTVQIFVKRADLDPGQFLRQLQTQWLAACKGSQPASINPILVNGYAAASMTLSCPVLASTGKPETTSFRAVKGNDSFYLVQRAVRVAAAPELLERLRKYLADVSVCEAGSREHPCPDLKPIGR